MSSVAGSKQRNTLFSRDTYYSVANSTTVRCHSVKKTTCELRVFTHAHMLLFVAYNRMDCRKQTNQHKIPEGLDITTLRILWHQLYPNIFRMPEIPSDWQHCIWDNFIPIFILFYGYKYILYLYGLYLRYFIIWLYIYYLYGLYSRFLLTYTIQIQHFEILTIFCRDCLEFLFFTSQQLCICKLTI